MEDELPEMSRPGESQPRVIDQMKLQMFMQQLRDNQNLSIGVLGGAAAAILGALVWGLVTAVSGWQIGFMAIGVGFIVGFAIRKLGQGVDRPFGIAGAVLSLCGCVLGNFLSVCFVIAEQEGLNVLDVLNTIDFEIAVELMGETFSPMDLVFYGIAVWYGYKHSFRQISNEEMATLARG